ncbi:olfactory receptor 14A16-like [Callospermophilus lateralis]|uniref:olfactory receptor 14A16-like n=1 Tax=Callospermophilus lateralis TaxID=76772 RepID=UPI0040385E5F
MNRTSGLTGFLLLGFPGPCNLQLLQAGALTAAYLAALVGNGLTITITSLDPGLHSPMYFFLRNLSLSDICLISAVVPKAVTNSVTHCHSISFLGCVSQVFLVPFSAVAELSLLTVMSMDCYAAICHPLHYEAIMSRDTCVQMVTLSWLSSGFVCAMHTVSTFSFSYCGNRQIQQFFCDIPQLLAISCSHNMTAEVVLISISAILDTGCFACIVVSYIFIFSTVRRIPSTAGQVKAYSTCLPHLAVVVLLLSTAFTAYLKPLLGSSSSTDLVLSAVYIVLPPSLNPVIYSLRNKAMKAGLEKLVTRKLLTKQHMLLFLHG